MMTEEQKIEEQIEELRERLAEAEAKAASRAAEGHPGQQEMDESAKAPPEVTQVYTAFLVFQDPQSDRFIATSDLGLPIEVIKKAELSDMYRAVVEVAKDIQVSEMTASLAGFMQQQVESLPDLPRTQAARLAGQQGQE